MTTTTSHTPRLLYVTMPSRQAALEMARQLVRDRLVACGNVLGSITSVYEWKGTLEESEEVVLLLKTRQEFVSRVMQRVVELHAYECPCVLEVPLGSAHPAFAQWIVEQTTERSSPD